MVAGAYPPPICDPFRHVCLDPAVLVGLLMEFFMHDGLLLLFSQLHVK